MRGLHGTSSIRVQTTPSGLWNTCFTGCPEASYPPSAQISPLQATVCNHSVGVKGAVGVTAVQWAPSVDVHTSPWRTPSITHILLSKTTQPKLSRGDHAAAGVTWVQVAPSVDDQTSLSCVPASP